MSTLQSKRHNPRRQGFTLVEILVVLAIMGIVTAITLGGFREMSQGNKRVSCQSNLSQIYQSCRMYAADEGGRFPYYGSTTTPNKAVDCANPANNVGIGLWAIYAFPATGNFNSIAPPPDEASALGNSPKPIARYVRSAKILHCPSDFNADHIQLYADVNPKDGVMDDANNNGNPDAFNESYLSYQTCDDGLAKKTPSMPFPNNGTATYSSRRTIDDSNDLWKRQLLHFRSTGFVLRLPADNTIVTWCPWHRGPRDFDNVLFYDGSVQVLPRDQGSGPTFWKRFEKSPT